MEQIHSLLQRQLKRYFGDQFHIPKDWQGFIDSVNDAYWESDKNGSVIGILGTYEDITEQKRAMETLNLLSHAVKSIGESISIVDLNNNLLFVNEAFLKTYGYTEQEIIGKPMNIVSCDPTVNDQVVLAETIKGGWQGERMHRKKDGTVFSVFLSTSIVNDENGNPIGLVGVATDISERKHAEEALRESDEKLRNIVENSTNLFYSRNTDQVFTYLSPQARDILDCEPDEALVNITDFMTDNSINKLGSDLAKKAVQTGARQEAYELELMSRRGRRVWVEIQEAPVVIDGKTISIVGAATDITERRWAERALQVSEKKYRDIVTWAPIGIYQSTHSGKLLSCNSSIAEMLDYDNVNGLVGCNMGQDIYYDDKDRERFIAKDNSSEKKGTFSHETRWKKKNGSIIWVLMTVHDVRDKSSEILYYEGFVFDITERKHAEEALRESEERYRLLVENSTDIVTEISDEDKYLYVSPNVKPILDFEPLDLVGTEVLSRVYGKDKGLIGEILSKLGGSATYRYRDRIGGWHWFESSGRVYYTSSGEQRMVMVSRDITQRRKAEQELELSRKQLQHFTEHLEHVLEEERKRISRELHDELGQLLTILKFDISWLRLEGVKSDSEAIAKIDAMMESVNEALASVKRIAKEIRPPQLDALGLVGAIQWDIDQSEKKTGLKGIVTVEPAELEIKGQISTVLYRVFREALTNILRHAQAEQIFVRLSQRLGSINLIIRDDGRGITKKELKGTASLGLVGIRERIRMVGGTITIEGKTGSGTMLSVEVPLKKKNGDRKS
jgi:PAS domain S-box-containing protein